MAVGRSEAQSALWWARRRDWALLGEPHPASKTARNPSTTVVFNESDARVRAASVSLSDSAVRCPALTAWAWLCGCAMMKRRACAGRGPFSLSLYSSVGASLRRGGGVVLCLDEGTPTKRSKHGGAA